MIRPATSIDIPRIIELGGDFVAATILPDLVPYDPESATETVTAHVVGDQSCVFVLEIEGQVQGFIMGSLAPMYWNKHVIAGQQYAWYVDPAHRGVSSLRLLVAFERWCKLMGAHLVFSGAKHDRSFQSMDKMLTGRTYVQLESVYLRRT